MLDINIASVPAKTLFFYGTRKWRTRFLGCLRSRCAPLSNSPAVTSFIWGAGDLIFSLSPCKGVWPCTLCPLDDWSEHMRWQPGAKGVSRAQLSFSCWRFPLHDNLKPPLNQRWGFPSPLPQVYLYHAGGISSLLLWTWNGAPIQVCSPSCSASRLLAAKLFGFLLKQHEPSSDLSHAVGLHFEGVNVWFSTECLP